MSEDYVSEGPAEAILAEAADAPTRERVLVAHNPKAGRWMLRDVVPRLVKCLEGAGLHAELVSDLDQMAEKANQWHIDGELRALVGVGGDGTAAELVNRTQPGVPITMLPRGTENLLAKHFLLGPGPAKVCRTVLEGRPIVLDAGQAGERLFLLMASCGFDASVVERLHAERTGHIHRLKYVKPIVTSLRTYRYPELRIYCGSTTDEQVVELEPVVARWAFVFNLPCYARGLRFVPEATGRDGLLDVCTFRQGTFASSMHYLWHVIRGIHHTLEDFTCSRGRCVRVEADEPVPYQLDGDPGGQLPMEFHVLPKRWTLLVPPY